MRLQEQGLAIDPAVYTVEALSGSAGAEKGGRRDAEGHHPGPVFPRRHRGPPPGPPGRRSCWWSLYIVALFCAKSLLAYGILAAVLAVCVRISRVGIKSLVRGLKPVVFIIVFTGILNLFFTPGEHILAELGFLRISAEGLQNAVFMVLRIMLLIMGTFLMTLHHQPHQPHRRAGAPAGRIEKNPCAGP